jgi:DNA mismatch repair protein MutS2
VKGPGEIDPIEARTLELLEWPELCARLETHAVSPLGAYLCRTLLPQASDRAAALQMELTREMIEVLTREGRIPLDSFPDLSSLLGRAARGEGLSGQELRQVAGFLGVVRGVRVFLQARRDRFPGLADRVSALQEAAQVRESVVSAIDEDGNVREDASPKLKALRREARSRREAVLSRLEGFLRDRESARSLQDSYYTVREGRFVLPVRADARGALGGIVHDISASGATHFVEPPWLVELNNQLRVASLEVEKEIQRILGELSCAVAATEEAIRVDQEVMAHLDLIHARARLSMSYQGSVPQISAQGEVAIRGLRHPILALRNVGVVANDLVLDPGARMLVISGPNAGGKTVLLKAAGLAALMARAGLAIPADAGSRLPFFTGVFADIGDQQDLHEDVSTFSGHMRNVRLILEAADQGSLVLLDELAGSTDPHEGTALALAVLERLQSQGSRVLVSTHYAAVKAWAQDRPGVKNAAMGFDWERMVPTYRLHPGLAGRSSALEIAGRMGLPEGVLADAAARLRGDEVNLEALLREVERQRQILDAREEQGRLLNARLAEAVALQEKLATSLRQEREAFLREKRGRLSSEIREARQRIREALRSLERSAAGRDVEAARAVIRGVEAGMRPPPLAPARAPLPLGAVHAGDPVEVLPIGQRGILLDEPSDSRGRLRVRVGGKELSVQRDSLGGVEAPGGPGPARVPGAEIRGPAAGEIPSELDLRGMRVDEALESVARYLDQALLGRRHEVRIVHGHGTGALKQAVRQWLSQCPWIGGVRPGQRGEGGDGATVVWWMDERAPGGAAGG